MKHSLVYRDAQIEDLPAIVEIYNSIVASRMVTADTDPVTVEQRIDWFQEHRPERRPVWMVETTEGKIVGWVSFSDFYGRPAYNGTAEVSIYLHEDFRGQGLGRPVLTHAIEAAPGLGITTLLGVIFSHNIPSIQLFKKMGFQEWGQFPDIAELDGIKRSVTILGKQL